MNSALALTQVPNQLAAWSAKLGPVAPEGGISILLFYVVLGAVMDELSMILLTIPIFFPLVIGLDFGMPPGIGGDLVRHHGADDGRLWPAGAAGGPQCLRCQRHGPGVPIAESYRGVLPFLVSDVLRTLLLLFFPGISLWLVKYIA